jgi:hypothetical protein
MVFLAVCSSTTSRDVGAVTPGGRRISNTSRGAGPLALTQRTHHPEGAEPPPGRSPGRHADRAAGQRIPVVQMSVEPEAGFHAIDLVMRS